MAELYDLRPVSAALMLDFATCRFDNLRGFGLGAGERFNLS
jgi:hypothetical protein